MTSSNAKLNYIYSTAADPVSASTFPILFNPNSMTTSDACSPSSTDPFTCISNQPLPTKDEHPLMSSSSFTTNLSNTSMKVNPKDSLLSLPSTHMPLSIPSTSFPLSSSSTTTTTTTTTTSSIYDFISVFVQFQPTKFTSHFHLAPNSNDVTSSPFTTSEKNPTVTATSPLASTPPLPNHTYVLSRFLISRYLTAIQIEKDHALSIASLLKKSLIDQYSSHTSSVIQSIDASATIEKGNHTQMKNVPKVQVSQTQLEQTLFQLLLQFGYSSFYCHRFQLMQQWHQQRRPLLLFLIGTKGLHKSFVAQTLAERLNISSVVKTEVIAELMRSMTSSPPSLSCWSFINQPLTFLKEYTQECRLVQQGLQHDLDKCLKEGRSMIVVGPHLDLGLVKAVYHHWYSYSSCSSLCRNETNQSEKLKMDGLIVPFLLMNETNKVFMENTSSPLSSSTSQTPTAWTCPTEPLPLDTNSYSTPTSTSLPCSLTDFEECCDQLQTHLLDQFHQFAALPSSFKKNTKQDAVIDNISSLFQSSFKTIPFNLYSHPEQQLNEMHSHVLNLIEEKANFSISPSASSF